MITVKIDEGTPWVMLFADDLVLCDPDREMMEVRLERWRVCCRSSWHADDVQIYATVGRDQCIAAELLKIEACPICPADLQTAVNSVLRDAWLSNNRVSC